MEILTIEGTDDTPTIILDKATGAFEISGRSLSENALEFYLPVIAWIEEYARTPNDSTTFIFRLDYSNTASSKLIQDIMMALEKIPGTKIIWYSQKDDEDMEEAGHEFSEVIDVPFEFKTF